jgi:hypothetical protein
VVNGMPLAELPFSAAEFASRFAFAPHENAVNVINSIDRDAHATILLWRAVQQAKENPVGRVEQAMWEPAIAVAGADAACSFVIVLHHRHMWKGFALVSLDGREHHNETRHRCRSAPNFRGEIRAG